MKFRLAVAAAAIAAIAAGTTYATASLTSSAPSTNTIQACVKDNGDVRIVASASQCRTPEHAISWNVVGPKGDTGATGARGPAGADGLSVESTALTAGDANCPFGGSSFTIGLAPATFACNGAPGAAGKNGTNGINGTNGVDGKDGTTFASIDGLSGLACTTGGQPGTVVVGSGAGNSITLTCQITGGGGSGGGGGGGGGGGTTGTCTGTAPTYPHATTTCSNGSWVIGTCDAGYADADLAVANGCEINLMTDVNNCGTVGNVVNLANATGGCVNGQAVILYCNAGFVDYDGNAANGCERTIASCTHQTGILGGTYYDCADPLGTPGFPETYNLHMAELVASTVSGSPTTQLCSGAAGIAASDGTSTTVWVFSGSLAGHVRRVTGSIAQCPRSGDPTWN